MNVMITSGISGGSCSVNALATYLDLPHDEVEELLKVEAGFSRYRGVSTYELKRLLKELGFTYVEKTVRLTSKNAVNRLPRKAILHFSKHVAAYSDGVIFDTWNTLYGQGTKQIRGYWVIED